MKQFCAVACLPRKPRNIKGLELLSLLVFWINEVGLCLYVLDCLLIDLGCLSVPFQGSATLHHWQQLAQPHLGGILDPRPGVVTKGFRTLDLDLDEVYCLNDYEEDETGDISYKGLTTSTPVQHTETSGERSQAQVTVSENKNNPRQSQAFTEEMQESTTDDDEGSGEGNSLSPVKLTSLQDFDYWAIFTSLQNSIHNIALCVASAR